MILLIGVEGHSVLGVNIVRPADVGFSGPHKIRNNGSSTADPSVRSGIHISRSSLTTNRGTEIANNNGPGIVADLNSSLALLNVTIANNSEQGVRVIRQSVAGFFSPLTIAGNGGASISCDTTLLVFGELAGIPNLDCSRIERVLGPPRPGKVLQ